MQILRNGFKYPETIVTEDIAVVILLFQTNSTVVKLTTPESIITYHNALCSLCKILHNHCLQSLLGIKMAPRETENNAYAKFWGDKQTASWYVMVFSGVVNWYLN